MKLHVISDTHTKHRDLNLPGGDVLIHAGDIMGSGYKLIELIDFLDWFDDQNYKHKIFIAGNHDRIFEDKPDFIWHILMEEYPDIIYLQDKSVTIDGINFYGSPWTPEFCGWAFQIHNDYEDTETYKYIPEDTDVLITHGPAYGILDQYVMAGQLSDHLGSKGLRKWIDDNNPRLHICGHIHTGDHDGAIFDGVTTHINASCLGEDYNFKNDKGYLEWVL